MGLGVVEVEGAMGRGIFASPLLCLRLLGGTLIAILTVPTTGLPLPKLLARLGGGTDGYVRFDLWVASSLRAPFKFKTPLRDCWGGGGSEEGVVRVVNCDPGPGKNGCVGEREYEGEEGGVESGALSGCILNKKKPK